MNEQEALDFMIQKTREVVEQLRTSEVASNLTFRFSNNMHKKWGKCNCKVGGHRTPEGEWQGTHYQITYSLPFIRVNAKLGNQEALEGLVKHEAAHTVVYRHGPEFTKVCAKIGLVRERARSHTWRAASSPAPYAWYCLECGTLYSAYRKPCHGFGFGCGPCKKRTGKHVSLRFYRCDERGIPVEDIQQQVSDELHWSDTPTYLKYKVQAAAKAAGCKGWRELPDHKKYRMLKELGFDEPEGLGRVLG